MQKAVSLPLVVPALTRGVADADPSVAWAVSLPQVAFVALLAHHLDRTARAAGDRAAADWWRWGVTGGVVMILGPVVVYPLGSLGLIAAVAVVSLAVEIFVLVLLLDRKSTRLNSSHRT